ncbi:MAG: FlgD immunoglobulin-like domain containing protein [candidate division WOR-3 bacterium]|nr:FlgD immunoglobulin-like domain containing protein [candidate division WOR-3 bacterium]
MSKKLFAAALILGFAAAALAAVTYQHSTGYEALRPSAGWETTSVEGGSVSWSSPPKKIPNGWYWMYDNTESGPPFSDPYVAIPSWSDAWYSITDVGNMLAPYSDQPFKYTLEDSFWYYGHFYKPGDYLYISPDGWISFDPAAASGFPDPPSADPPFPVIGDPNSVIAPLWQDMDPTQTPDPTTENRVYYYYDAQHQALAVEWYNVQGHANTHTYHFQVALQMGGQQKLLPDKDDPAYACGVVFSYHFINFLYNTSSNGWTADNGKTGIENQSGEYGIYYKGALANHRIIRAGYKRIFKHDVSAYAFLSPGPMVLRWTRIQPQVVVSNIGEEVEHFPLFLDIYDDENDSLVYSHTVSGFSLMPGESDTMVCPCWEPGEIGTTYRKVAYPILDRDSCVHNDTLEQLSFVHCDDTFRYAWNWADVWMENWAGTHPDEHLFTFYPVGGGVLVTGGQVYINSPVPGGIKPTLDLWGAQAGCGKPDLSAGPIAQVICETYEAGWNKGFFGDFGVWVTTPDPGNFWIGSGPSGAGNTGSYIGVGLRPLPTEHSCYEGKGGYRHSRSMYRCGWGSLYWGVGDTYENFLAVLQYDGYTWPIEAFVHLGFGAFPLSPMPSPPCYYDNAHDLTCFRMEQPSDEWVEADVPITPELAIANIGRQAEPDYGFIPAKFIAVNDATLDTVFCDSAMIAGTNPIGWLGDDTDDPDTLYATTPPWTPEGLCDEEDPSVSYELIGLVRLGEVGPDGSDHCPYNDTVRNHVTCLLSHDVGVIAMTWPEPPDEGNDTYYPGSKITVTATVKNFGFHEEHDVEVRLEIRDVDSNDVELWHALKSIEFINWRGNQFEEPYTADVTFPSYTVANEHHQKLECRTELLDDNCPKDDGKVRHINTGIAETPAGLPFALDAITPNPFVGSTTISFAVPATVNVSLKVYDITGKLVTTLVSGNQAPGRHSVVWNGTDDLGRSVAQGIYLVRMDAASFSATKKVVLY